MANISMQYEAVLIFSVQSGDEGVTALSNKFKALIEENATSVDKVEEWGKRKLAYPINDELEGFYLYIEFTSKPDFPAELDRVLKITDGVLRSMIIRKDEESAKTKAKAKGKEKEEVKAAGTAEEVQADEKA